MLVSHSQSLLGMEENKQDLAEVLLGLGQCEPEVKEQRGAKRKRSELREAKGAVRRKAVRFKEELCEIREIELSDEEREARRKCWAGILAQEDKNRHERLQEVCRMRKKQKKEVRILEVSRFVSHFAMEVPDPSGYDSEDGLLCYEIL